VNLRNKVHLFLFYGTLNYMPPPRIGKKRKIYFGQNYKEGGEKLWEGEDLIIA
jgi:hypothetical protein